MKHTDTVPVASHTPPPAVLRVVNPIITWILRSPLHGVLSKKLALLTVTGRRTGREYTVPIGRHEDDGVFIVSVSGSWRYNLEGEVRLTVGGRELAGYAEIEDDPKEVARTYKMLYDRYGSSGASLIGLKVNVPREPTVDEIGAAVADRWVARIHVTKDNSGHTGEVVPD